MNAITQALWDYASNHELAYQQVNELASVAKLVEDMPSGQALAEMLKVLVTGDWLRAKAHPNSCHGFVLCAVLREIEYRAFAERWLA